MSGVSLPVTRPTGRSLLVGGLAAGAEPAATLRRLGCAFAESDDPYAATSQLAAQPLAFSSVVLCLNTLFRDELRMISTVKQRFPHIEIWLARYEGRQRAVDEAMHLGADGLLDADGLHRMSSLVPPQAAKIEADAKPAGGQAMELPPEPAFTEPVLSADELRALLDEPPLTGPQ
jgi:hypothetical protein